MLMPASVRVPNEERTLSLTLVGILVPGEAHTWFVTLFGVHSTSIFFFSSPLHHAFEKAVVKGRIM